MRDTTTPVGGVLYTSATGTTTLSNPFPLDASSSVAEFYWDSEGDLDLLVSVPNVSVVQRVHCTAIDVSNDVSPSLIGAPNGLATLGADGVLTAAQRPSGGDFIPTTQRGAASGVATLNGAGTVVQQPASATSTPTANAIPIADATGKLDAWVTVTTPNSGTTTPSASSVPKSLVSGKLDPGWVSETLALQDLTDVGTSVTSAGDGVGLRKVSGSWAPSGKVFSAAAYGVVGDNSNASASANSTALDACITAAAAVGDGALVMLDWTGTAYLNGGHKIYSRVRYQGNGENKSKLANSRPANTNVWETASFQTLTQTVPSSYTAGEWEFQFVDHSIDGNKANNATGGCGLAIMGYGYYLDNLRIENCAQAGWWAEWGKTGSAGEPIGVVGSSGHQRAMNVGRMYLVSNDCNNVPAKNQRLTDGKASMPVGQMQYFGPGDSYIGYIEAYRDGSVQGTGLMMGGTMDTTATSYTNFDLTIGAATVWLNHNVGLDMGGSNMHVEYAHIEGANTNVLVHGQGGRILDGKVFGPQPSGTNLNFSSGGNYSYWNLQMDTTGNSGTKFIAFGSSILTEAVVNITMSIGNPTTFTLVSGTAPDRCKALSLTASDFSGGTATITAGFMLQCVTAGANPSYRYYRTLQPMIANTYSKAGPPATTDIPAGSWSVWRDTTAATTKIYYNNAGTIIASAAFA